MCLKPKAWGHLSFDILIVCGGGGLPAKKKIWQMFHFIDKNPPNGHFVSLFFFLLTFVFVLSIMAQAVNTMPNLEEIDKLQMIPGVPFSQYYEFFMDWKTPIVIAGTYALTIHLLNPKTGKLSRVEAKNRGVAEKSSKRNPLMTSFVFLHNLALAIYSMITFYHMARGINRSWFQRDISMHDAVSVKEN